MSATLFFPIQLEGDRKINITDQGITLMIRGMVHQEKGDLLASASE
jgi:hypothetical protein